MDIVITEWALESYLNLRHEDVFSEVEYWTVLRPDVELLKDGFPFKHEQFQNPKFWGPAKGKDGKVIQGGYKMKWHNIGNGRVQLRLLVVLQEEKAFLCQAYVKSSDKKDFREMAKLKIYIHDIVSGRFVMRGLL